MNMGSYPALLSLEGPGIEVDILEISSSLIRDLDIYEGVDNGLYKRETIEVDGVGPVEVYVFTRLLKSWRYTDSRNYPSMSFHGQSGNGTVSGQDDTGTGDDQSTSGI